MKQHPLISEIRKKTSIAGIRRVLVALSGGADSIAASYALLKAGIEIKALHCNFHLRGEESNRDQLFVEKFCFENNISLEIIHFNIDEYIEQHPGNSIEMACRNLRHQWFDNQLHISGFDRIATGHNADDNIETLFLNLLRGSGTRGLKGMTEDTRKIWRPLLKWHRKDILEFINLHNLDYIIDSSNLENNFRRNFLRNEVIPLIKSQWKGFDRALDASLSYIYEENKIVENVTKEADLLAKSGVPLKVETILLSPSPLSLIRRYIEIACPFPTTSLEIFDAIKANKPHARKWKLRSGNVSLRNGKLSVVMGHSE